VASKTLLQMRASVRILYGDSDGVTATDAECDSFLKDGVNRVLADCPWLLVTLDATEAITTDVLGGIALASTFNIEQVYSVEIQRSDSTWQRLENVHPGRLNSNLFDITSVNQVAGYYMDGHRITLFPMLRSTAATVRILYSSNSIGSAFPTASGDPLPPQIPVAAEEAAIRHAVARLHMRDNNFEAAQFIDGDVETWIQKIKVAHNRPERGEVLTVWNPDAYSLEMEY